MYINLTAFYNNIVPRTRGVFSLPPPDAAANIQMPENKQKKTRSPLRRTLKAVCWTAGILVFLTVFAGVAALFTIDRWIVPLGAWCAGVEIEGEPGVMVSIANREIILTGLKAKCPAGQFEAKSCGLTLDSLLLDGFEVKEVRVSHVHAEGLRGTLDFARYAAFARDEDERPGEPISGEKVRLLSHLIWKKASKPVVRMADLTLLDAEVRWKSGVVQGLISIPDLNASFDDGLLTRPQLACGVKYRLNDSQRLLECGARVRITAPQGGESLIVSAAANRPFVIDLPDSHLEFPSSESTEIVMQYEPETDSVRFGGEWTNSDHWEYKPWSLSMDKMLSEVFGTLALDGERLCLKFGINAMGSGLVCRDADIPGDVLFEAKGNVEFDLVTGGVTLDSVSGRLVGPNGGRIDLETAGVFEFMRHEDATYTLDPHAARLSLSTGNPVDLTPFDPVLPFDSADRELSFDYSIELDPEKNCLLGGANAVVRDLKTMRPVFDADAEFETNGIVRIGSFHVPRCRLSFYDGEDQICNAHLAGEYNIRTASLRGGLKYFPYRMIKAYGDQSLADLCSFLDDANLSEAEHAAEVELDLDLVNMAAKFHKESHLSHLALTGTGGTILEVVAIGDADFRLAPDDQGWQLECGLDLKAGTDFHAVLNASGGSMTAVSGHVEVDHLSDVLARQLERKFFPGREDLPALRFVDASAAADFRCEPVDSHISLSRLNVGIDNGDGRLSVQCGSDFTWKDGAFSCLPMNLKMKTAGLPVSFWDPLLGEDDAVRFASGDVTSEFDLSISADGAIVGGEGKLVGNNLTVLLDGSPREMARLGLNGTFQFERERNLLILPEVNVDIQDRQARQTLFAGGSGTVDLADENRVRMKFPEARFGPEALYLIGYGVQRSFYFEDLDAAGQVEFHADHDFHEMSWTGGLKINRLRLQSDEPEEYRFPELSGRLEGELSWTEGEMFGDVSIRLADEEGEEHISGQYLYRRGEDALPKFISSSLDLPFSVSYFRYNHNTDPGVEKTAVSLVDKTFELDLHGIYSRNHALIFSAAGLLEMRDGDDPAILVPHAEFSGDVFGSASAEIHMKDGSWPFEVEADLKNIPFDKSFTAFLATDDSPEIPRRLHGFVKRLKAVVRGEGFTTEALTKNLQADCTAELEGVSLRTYLRDRSLFLNILLLPLVSVPRLIDYVPGDMLRRALRLTTGGALMDMISGDAPVEFRRGMMEMSVRQGVVDLKMLELEGEQIESYRASGTVNLAGDGEAELETTARFALFQWPFYLTGNIFDPKVSYGKSISHFFTDNAKHLITLFPNMIMSAFSEEDAEEIDRMESEKEKSKKAE